MDSRIQFRVSEETKQLAQKNAKLKGVTLSDACRNFTEQLAEEQRNVEQHEEWLKEKVDAAFARIHNGTAIYLSHENATKKMLDFKEKIRSKHSNGTEN